MPIATRKMKSGLLAKGFVLRNKKHKAMYYVTEDGVTTSIITHFSHGASGKEISDRVVRAMAGQCKLSFQEFQQLVKCTLTRNEYEHLLLDQGIIEQPNVQCDALNDEE